MTWQITSILTSFFSDHQISHTVFDNIYNQDSKRQFQRKSYYVYINISFTQHPTMDQLFDKMVQLLCKTPFMQFEEEEEETKNDQPPLFKPMTIPKLFEPEMRTD
ncbi:Hypothetical_protein [Hexamita inflata]|uniref:Hypothetical_protein n=1 Tax=Hexamita inflata TaxID=28002 RepID=A0AA86PGI9_9EUKA|nr:Hypothetical protein HINF_LOCUS23032 [Hexamita inflata]